MNSSLRYLESPLTLPSPPRGEGRVRGKDVLVIWTFEIGICDLGF
jgi:hypothetical protein